MAYSVRKLHHSHDSAHRITLAALCIIYFLSSKLIASFSDLIYPLWLSLIWAKTFREEKRHELPHGLVTHSLQEVS